MKNSQTSKIIITIIIFIGNDKHYGILNYDKWYEYQQELIREGKGATILLDFTIQTDWKIKAIDQI